MRFYEFSSRPAVKARIDLAKATERQRKANDTINKARAKTAKAGEDFQAKQDADDDAERAARKQLARPR
jgi:hypothetical protein